MKDSILTLLFAIPIIVTAQFVNTGEIYIVPGTEMSIVSNYNNTGTGFFVNDGVLHIYSNWNNNGLVTFTEGREGITNFFGDTTQLIGGLQQSDFYNVHFLNNTNTPAFLVASDVSIKGEAIFERGVINIATEGLIIFESNSNHTLVSDFSHVNGLVRKIGAENFQFPIGNEQFYRNAAISGPENVNNHFTSEYIFENSNSQFPHINKEENIIAINDTEYWEINETNGNSSVAITLSWNENTTIYFKTSQLLTLISCGSSNK